MFKRIFPKFLSVFILISCFNIAYSQPNWAQHLVDSLKKPAKYKDHQLVSEITLPKKATIVREFIENTFTHYNYYYDANLKIDLVVEKAEAYQKDNYAKLLAFYPYTFENTMSQKKDLDSVILKATAGILLHDLRNVWIDNMYLLLGKAYFYRKQFDSAAITFQFINFNLFPRHPINSDEDQVVGTVDNASNGVLSISTKEDPNILQRIASLPPSRNDALVWLVRTYIEEGQYSTAGGIISTLQYDPNFPNRLRAQLEEVNAFLFFQQGNYDSTVNHLEKGLDAAPNIEDRARWEYLLAQLCEKTQQYDKATYYYNKAALHTTNLLLEIFADLNNAKMLKNADSAHLENGINNLLHMVKKDKYEMYRDVIYCSAGQLEMEKPDTAAAILYFTKSLALNKNDVFYKNKVLVDLGDIAFTRKDYIPAYNYYDSLKAGDSLSMLDSKYIRAQDRAKNLEKIAASLKAINREDSLQALAALSVADREIAVKKEVKKIRKERGIQTKDEYYDGGTGDEGITFNSSSDQATDLFGSGDKGEWYFYNAALKSKGYTDFKSKWGDRSNVDNWNRKSATDNNLIASGGLNPDDTTQAVVSKVDTTKKVVVEDISYKGLMANIPLTADKKEASNAILSKNLFKLGKLYQNNLEDYSNAVVTYERSLRLFPDSLHHGQLYFDLYYCYHKLGDTAKMAFYKNLLVTVLPDSRSAELLEDPNHARPLTNNSVVSDRYKHIYDLFIEGKFDSAVAEKINADTLYGQNYWSPQLLYIEAIYYIQYKCDDSAAIKELQHIVSFYRRSPLAPKAQNLINALRRRKEIEAYLNNLQVTRAKEDETVYLPDEDTVAIVDTTKKIIKDSVIKKMPKVAAIDTVKKVMPVVVPANQFSFNESSPQHVIMVITKVDNTYANEARNAFLRYNDEEFYGKQYSVDKVIIDNDHVILVTSPFTDAAAALQYYSKVNAAAPNEISWLEPSKYYFEIISEESLQLLEKNKDLSGYKNLLKIKYPGRFQ